MEPTFLSLDEVMEIHRDQIARYGGSEGVRDSGLLLSAIAVPQARHEGEFLHRDIFEMGAAYMFHIVCNHPFVDGNKRVGVVAGIVFLAMNDIEVEATEEELEEMVLSVAQGEAGKESIAEFLRGHVG